MRVLEPLLLLCAMVIPQVTGASEQAPNATRLNLGFSVGEYLVSGEDFDEAENGTGIRSYIGVGVGGETGFDLNLGFHFSRHGIDIPHYHINSYSVYAEPRVHFMRGAGISPFVGGRLGWAYAEGVSERFDNAYGGDGFVAGGMGGISFPIAAGVRGELTVSYTHLSFSPPSFMWGSDDRVGGATLGLQLGVALPLTVGGE